MDQSRIIKLITSNSLKLAIKNSGYEFSDMDLLKIIYYFSYSINQKKELFQYVSDNTNNCSTKKIIEQILKYLNANEAALYKKGDYIFEGFIDTINNDKIETLYSNNYIDLVKKLKRKYLNKKGNKYIVIRYDIISSQNTDKPEDFIRVILNDDFTINDIYVRSLLETIDNEIEDKIMDSYECYVKCPHFFNDGDLVLVKDNESRNYNNYIYGIIIGKQESYKKETMAYVVPLNSFYIREKSILEKDDHGYYKVMEDHCHIPFIDIEVIDPSNIDKEIKVNYEYFRDFYFNIYKK